MLERYLGSYRIAGKEDLQSRISQIFPTCDSSQVVDLIYKKLEKNNPDSVTFYGNGGLQIILHGHEGYSSLLYGEFVLKRSKKGQLILKDQLEESSRRVARIREK